MGRGTGLQVLRVGAALASGGSLGERNQYAPRRPICPGIAPAGQAGTISGSHTRCSLPPSQAQEVCAVLATSHRQTASSPKSHSQSAATTEGLKDELLRA